MRLEEFTQRIVDNYIANVTKQLTEVHNAKVIRSPITNHVIICSTNFKQSSSKSWKQQASIKQNCLSQLVSSCRTTNLHKE
ncbi:hypothetical protein RB195_000818 [Necator americanus]|uniref:Uncharacterized protein n=1 Tax=Necator americanus TaxID=51031 RepID=A0ABR1DBI8_NECAM